VGVKSQAAAALPPIKIFGTHCTGGWVGPRAGLDGCGLISSPRDSITASVQPLANRYTANTTPTAFFKIVCDLDTSTMRRPRPDVGCCCHIRRRIRRIVSDNYVINCINIKTQCSDVIRTQHKTGIFTVFYVLVPRIRSTETVHYLSLSIFYCLQLR